MSNSSQGLQLFWVCTPPRESIPAIRPSVPLYRVGEPLQRGRRAGLQERSTLTATTATS